MSVPEFERLFMCRADVSVYLPVAARLRGTVEFCEVQNCLDCPTYWVVVPGAGGECGRIVRCIGPVILSSADCDQNWRGILRDGVEVEFVIYSGGNIGVISWSSSPPE